VYIEAVVIKRIVDTSFRTVFFFLAFSAFYPQQKAAAQYLQFSKYSWESFDTSNSDIPVSFVSEIYKDRKGILWISMSGSNTLNIEPGGAWNHFDRSAPVSRGWINSWKEGNQGKYYMAGKFGAVQVFVPAYSHWDTIAVRNKQTQVLATNGKGIVLIGCNGPGTSGNLYQLQGQNARPMNDNYGEVLHIYVENNGDALVSFRNGLYRYKMKADGFYQENPKKISDLAFYSVAVDSKGTLWGTCLNDTWLHSLSEGKWKVYKTGPQELYCKKDGEEKYVAYNLLVLPDDRVLISTQINPGLAVFDGISWKAYKPDLKNPGDGISKIELGADGSIWCATSKNGLLVFRPSELIKPRKPRTKKEKENLEDSTGSNRKSRYEKPAEEGKKISYIPDTERIVKTNRSITVPDDSIMLRIWDDQVIDGDTVSIYFNGEALLKNKALVAAQDTFWLQLQEGDNEVLLYAHNLGSIPPNTATLLITHGKKSLGLHLNSDLSTCERILIRKKRR
jgi:hypothetical protein